MKTKKNFLEMRWQFEKKLIKTITGMVVFGMICFNDTIADVLEDVMDTFVDLIHDYTALSRREAETMIAVATLYLLVVGIDRFFTKLVPWTIEKIKKLHKKQPTQAGVSE